jgi:hypothetical protein
MVARVGPTVGMLRRWPSSPMRPSAVARPSTAVTMGMPIATRLPKVRARISMAAIRPTTSLLSVGDLDRTPPRLPPTLTSTPARRAGAVVSRMAPASSSVTSPLGMSSSTGVNAVVASLLTSPEAALANGSGAEATCGALASALYEDSTACLLAVSVILPLVTWKTTGLLPFCWGGKRLASRSVARWLSVPGRLRSLLVSAPTPQTSSRTTTTRPIQTATTTAARLAQRRPSRYRTPAMRTPFPPTPDQRTRSGPGHQDERNIVSSVPSMGGRSPLDADAAIPHSWNGPTWNVPRMPGGAGGEGRWLVRRC